MKNFWQQLSKPFTVLAPLDGVTDIVFRQMITQIGKPDVLFTEFTSCEGLQSDGKQRVSEKLLFKPNEQPIVAQIWGTTPADFKKTARDVKKLGFSGVDINMGCPIHDIIKYGACAGLIKNQKLTKEIINATKEGAGDLPLSVKTRIGFETQDVENWIGFLLQQKLAALTIHLRTVSELSKVPAHWEVMSKIIEMRNTYAPETLIIGNGDIVSLEQVQALYKQYQCDGFMVGRGIFANPWLFNKSQKIEEITVAKRFETFLQHIALFEKTWGDVKNFANLKKFCKAYINNFTDAASCREKIMETESLKELTERVTTFRQEYIL